MIIYYTHKYGNNKGESHKLLRYAIGDYVGSQKLADVMVRCMEETGGHGKPIIYGFDHFSISHSEGTWAVLIDEEDCGFDIQYHRSCDRMGIAARFYHETEYAAVRAAEAKGAANGQEIFFTIWARREALVKAMGLSVAETGLPPVTESAVNMGGKTWYFGSLKIPGSRNLSNAACTSRPVTEAIVKEIRLRDMDNKKDKNDKTAIESAYAYIASRMRSIAEVKKHLEGRGYGGEEVQETLNELIGGRYLDDYLYAVRYFEYNREKKRGCLRAARELIEKGIDRETVDNAREDFLYENNVDEFEDALEIARRELRNMTDGYSGGDEEQAPDERLIASIGRRLENRGFSRSDIYRVLEMIRRGDVDL